jgi:hypothetical protein
VGTTPVSLYAALQCTVCNSSVATQAVELERQHSDTTLTLRSSVGQVLDRCAPDKGNYCSASCDTSMVLYATVSSLNKTVNTPSKSTLLPALLK